MTISASRGSLTWAHLGDLHITTAQIPRTSIFNLPYGLQVTCNRVAGWELRAPTAPSASVAPGP